eukprot:CAMPEP_0118903400 /NCGR_PEP_ID=MMETSP1166-20130328/8280_1 /TAXON_ID=1104430 /ORGANISM="Chrysoreinhardia sp, Strain CCMP3193" /LENGTH=310 /DNA_ID=CAMNT_0006842627 /DNA_START=1 /DNA_END=933 /DNA_ORIENTATION=-
MAPAMSSVFASGKVAVITGASSGIGKAMATKFAGLGMTQFLVDVDAEELAATVEAVGKVGGKCTAVVADVADAAAMEGVAKKVFDEAGACHVLCNNAGVGKGGGPLTSIEAFRATIDVNAFGPIHGCLAFVPRMKASGEPGLVVNTGSKQGITAPPGNAAYNCSKAFLKTYTEALEHDLRTTTDTMKAALLIPGWVNSSIMLKSKRDQALKEGVPFDPDSVFFSEAKPQPGAWMPDQVVDFMLQELDLGRFYIVCPDNDVTRAVDNARMTWAMQDITEDRPPLSRWHPDYKDKFTAFLKDVVPPSSSSSS